LFLLNLVHYNLFAGGEIPFIMFSLTGANKIVKAITFILLIATSVLILNHCKKDNQTPRSYPRLRNTMVSDITDKGAGFAADLYSMGTEKIIEHGFVWGTTDPNIHYSDRIQLGPCDTPGIYSAYIVSTLKKDIKYIVKSYVQTADHVVYGVPADFKSLGSSAPILYSFEPHSAEWLDTIAIKGKNLSNVPAENIVKLNQTLCETYKSTDTTLLIVINSELKDLKSVLSVELAGNTSVLTRDTFRLIPPVVTDFNPKLASWGDTLYITGRGLKSFTFKSSNFIKLGTFLCIVLKVYNNNSLSVLIPYEINTINSNLSVLINGFNLQGSQPFQLKAPVFSFSPKAGAWNDIITLTGKFNTLVSRNTVSFSGENGTIKSSSANEIKVQVPTYLSKVKTKIIYNVAPFNIISADTFMLKVPAIRTFSPLSGTFNDEITITGENLIPLTGYTTASFSGIQANIKSITATSIVVTVPLTMDSIPRALTLRVGSNTVTSATKFTLTPHQIISISPGTISPSQDITINGLNFNPEPGKNFVFWDIYPLTVKSSTPTQIIATLPNSLPRGNSKIQVNVSGYKRFSSQEFSINSQWLKISAPTLGTNISGAIYDAMTIYGDAPGNLGYLCSPASNVLYKFDPTHKTFAKINTANPFYLTVKMGEVVCRDTFYLISGWDHYVSDGTGGMYAFNELSDKWRKINTPFTGRTGVAFSLNNKIYYGLDYWSGTKTDLWECDPANDYTWTKKSNIPVISFTTYSSYFSITDKGYVVFSDNTIWQYDPDSDAWTKKTNFPGPARRLAVSFVIGEFAYFGTGTGSIEYNDFWRYDPIADSWSQISGMPNSRNSGVAFVINNKAYVGYGDNYGRNTSDFYEFDPNYLLK
jgi:hypothetical protein